MNANDAEVVRVWTREVGGTCGDVTFPNNADFEIVVDVEAGSAKFNDGPQFRVGVVVKDLTHWSTVPATPTIVAPCNDTGAPEHDIQGSLNSPCWPTEAGQFVFRVAAGALPTRTNHILSVHAFLIVGVGEPDVSFVESSPFVIHAP